MGRKRTGISKPLIVVYAIFCLLIAVLAFLWPTPATVAAVAFIAAILIVSGIVALAMTVVHGGDHRLYHGFIGVISIALGVWMLLRPVEGAISLTLALAVWFFVRAGAELYFGLRRSSRNGWMVLMGLVNLLLAAATIVLLPAAAMILPGTLLALSFLVTAMAAFATARQIDQPEPSS